MNQYSLADARRAILSNWSPVISGLNREELARLTGAWQEVQRVDRAQAWTALCVLTGQITEALLKHKLTECGIQQSLVSQSQLAGLISLAESRGILPTGPFSPADGRTLDTARRLRNWAAHMTLTAPATSELEATQSLAILVAFAETLYGTAYSFNFMKVPDDVAPDTIESHWREFAPRVLLQYIQSLYPSRELPEFIKAELAEFYCHFVRLGSARTISTLCDYVSRTKSPREPLRIALVENFIDLVRNLSWSSLRGLLEVTQSLRSLNLRDHARVIAVLIPIDRRTLMSLIKERSPHRAARYVQQVATANPKLFRSAFNREIRRDKRFARAFWISHDDKGSFVANRFVLLAKFPASVRSAVLSMAPVNLIEKWSKYGVLGHVLDVLWLIYSRTGSANERARQRRLELLQLMLCRIRAASLTELRHIPWIMFKRRITDTDFGSKILREILERIPSSDEWRAIRQLLWDTYQTSRELSGDAIRLTQNLISAKRAPVWDYFFLIGIAVTARAEIPSQNIRLDLVKEENLKELEDWLETATTYDAALAMSGWLSLSSPSSETPARLHEKALGILSQQTELLPSLQLRNSINSRKYVEPVLGEDE